MRRDISLNGEWQLGWCDHQRGDRLDRLQMPGADASRLFPATVPGEVHLDLMRAGLIGDPAVGLEALRARWVEDCVWRYRREFAAPALVKGERAYLVFEGLDLAATVYVNGREAGRHANAFYPCVLDVTALLRRGRNLLLVDIEAGLYHGAEKPVAGYCGVENTLSKRHWLRKPQFEFGWDWSPRLGNVGLHGNVTLRICRDVRVDGVTAIAELTPDLQQGTVRARVFAEGLGLRAAKGRLTVRIRGAGVVAAVSCMVAPGVQTLEVVLKVDRPELWWPVNHGSQRRYTVEIELAVAGRRVLRTERSVGFRHVRFNQGPHPVQGRYFILEVNGKPIFAKGGNLVPADLIPARLDRQRYAGLVDRALEANFNFLRVWGGGLYESDDFFALCDAKGILVWQEFIFACARYPSTDERFLADVRREAAYQVRRLAHHPSLVAWCGNNEIEWGCWSWGYEQGVALPDHALYHLVLPRILKQEDGSRYYQPSSPYSPDGEEPNHDLLGDQHPWSIGFTDTDFRKYRTMACRFPNEGGILGPTALPTVRACLPPGHERPGSFAWEQHDNSMTYLTRGDGPARSPDRMLEEWMGRRLADMTLEDYVYLGGVVHGAGLAEYILNFRRRMFDSASAIFWMYNDCWPAVRSWTIVDYYLRRTPAFHPVRRAFAPLTVALVLAEGRVRVYGINEGPAWRGTVRYGVCRLAGGLPVDESRAVTLPANAATVIAEFAETELARRGLPTHVAFALLSRDGREAARATLIQPLFKEMRWPAARVRVRLAAGKAVFTSATFAWRVCLDLDGERALPDNFFDVLPGIPTVLDWPAALGHPRILRIGNAR